MTITAGWTRDADRSAPAQETAKRADIQGLRAIAVVLVVIYHAQLPLPAGFAGVDVFFVISGFVITGQMQRLRDTGRFGFASFYARRIRRLLPAMVVMLLVVMLLAFLFQSPIDSQGVTAGTAWAAVLLYGNHELLTSLGGYFAAGATMNPLTHVWSLNVEEQFYLVFPLLLVLTWKLGRGGARSQLTGLGVLTAASFALSLWLSFADFEMFGRPVQQVAFYSAPARAWEFGVGAMLAVVLSSAAVRRRLAGRRPAGPQGQALPMALGAAGLLLLVTLNLKVSHDTVWPGTAAIIPVAATALLLLAGAVGEGPIKRMLSSRPFVVTGDLSYSIYLWHWPMIVIGMLVWPTPFTMPLAAALSVVPAYLSYRWVEQPLRHGEVPLSRVYLSAAVAVGVVLLASQSLLVGGPKAIPGAEGYNAQRAQLTVGRATQCLVTNESPEPDDFERCMVTVPNAKGWVMLAGDSHADSLSSGLVEANRALGYNTLILTASSCPFIRDAQPSPTLTNCADMANALIDLAIESDDPPALVVIGQWAKIRHDADGTWPQRLVPTMRELTDAGVPVMYSMDVPNFATEKMNRQAACSGGYLTFVCDRSEQEILDYQGASRDAEAEVVRQVPGVAVFDPWEQLCDGTTCSPLIDGRLGYWDFNHLNRIGSMSLADDLEVAVGAVLSRQ